MSRLLVVMCALLGSSTAVRADLPPPPPPPPPGARVEVELSVLVAGVTGAAGFVLVGAGLARRNRLARS